MKAIGRRLAGAGALVAFVAVWQLATFGAGDYWVPGPAAVARRLAVEAAGGALARDVAATAWLMVVGTALGLVLGAAAASASRLVPRLDRALQPLITAAMSVPKLGLVPLLVLWFGTGWGPKLLLVALTAFFIVFSMTYAGLGAVEARLVMTARVFGADRLQVMRAVVLPTVWPFVLTGLQVALPWTLSAALVAEYLSAEVGVGHAIDQARQVRDSVGVFAGILVATALVLVANAGVALLRRRTIRWQ